jgi:hypothetical protein
MPLATFTLLKGQPAALKIKLGNAVVVCQWAHTS